MNRRQFLHTSTAAVVSATLAGCTKPAQATGHLRIFSWANYISRATLESFQAKHACTVTVDTYDTNTQLLNRIQGKDTGYDIILPSSYLVPTLQREGKIQAIRQQSIANRVHVDPTFLGMTNDPEMVHSIPYMVAPTCLAYRASKVSAPTASWSLLARTDLKGQISILDSMREVLGAALKAKGFSLNSTHPSELSAARELVQLWVSNQARFNSHQYASGFETRDLAVIHGYAGDLLQVAQSNEDIHLIIPSEGCAWTCDSLCITHDCANVELAHAWIQHTQEPEICAANMESIGCRSPNRKATSLLSDDFKGASILFPDDDILHRCELIKDLGDQLPLWTAEWQKITNR